MEDYPAGSVEAENALVFAHQCLILENRQRPEMVEVADRLRKCMKDLQLCRREEMPESSGSIYPANPTKKEQPTQKITRNFSYDTLIGQGSHAEVFLGELKDSRKCAVKMLDYPDVEELDNEFLLKVQSISRLEHKNVVQLLSYCIEGNVRALVYEYSSRGSLHDILHGDEQ
ncbi:pto-interacting protein 1 isoform X1 [Panicum miliaceum]|uniref:Pto-interacting protein 1 isoform X1 n=1 Tax=Panicum miliaceum TaxID=4540 RepID=A0A3L6QZL4_PANMI|nr:pto-interacting protein 1 isoform X1 [Panicum miliaceum]